MDVIQILHDHRKVQLSKIPLKSSNDWLVKESKGLRYRVYREEENHEISEKAFVVSRVECKRFIVNTSSSKYNNYNIPSDGDK
jgi:hypothetical protein